MNKSPTEHKKDADYRTYKTGNGKLNNRHSSKSAADKKSYSLETDDFQSKDLKKNMTPIIVSKIEFEKHNQYMMDNEFLHEGWRLNYFKFSDCFKSLFELHNETLNIWSHIIGTQILMTVMIYFMFYLDYGKDFYLGQIEKVQDLHLYKSFDSIMHNIESFQGSLVEIYKQQSGNIRETVDSLDSTIESILTNKQEIFGFFNYFKAEERIRQPSDWKFQMSEYHKYVIDVNNDLHTLKTFPNPITALDFKTMSVFDKLGNALPKKEGYPDLTIIPIILYIVCAMTCLIFSVLFHWFQPMNAKLKKILLRLDMSGITICIFGSVTAVIFYADYCNPIKRNIWIVCQFVVNIGTFILTGTQDWIHEVKYTKLKAMLLMACAFFAGLYAFSFSFDSLMAGPKTNTISFFNPFMYLLMMGGAYIGGAFFYMFKFPESMFPGKFNVFNSHSIWHFCVFLGQVSQLFVILETYKNRLAMKCINID